MVRICYSLSLKVAEVKELSTNLIKEIAGSPEIKGVRGTDKRKYLIDMMRINPRDANYQNNETFSACVVRDELIKLFQLDRQRTHIKK